MKKGAILVLFLWLLTACAQKNPLPQETTVPNSEIIDSSGENVDGESGMSQVVRQSHEHDYSGNVELSDELIIEFTQYYASDELRMMPSFNDIDQVDFDEFCLYIYLSAKFDDFERTEQGLSTLSAEIFEENSVALFARLPADFEHGESEKLSFENDRYTPKGFSYHGRTYYRIKSLTVNGGIYSAVFDAYEIDESDFFEPNSPHASDTMKAVTAYMAQENLTADEKTETDVLIDYLFLEENYSRILGEDENSHEVSITFELSDNSDFPFVYSSKN